MLDLSLFPEQEEWGTGDEAVDNKLSTALKKTITTLSFESIIELDQIQNELRVSKKFRYKNQMDFSINLQDSAERNPFVRNELKSYLNEEQKADLFPEPLFVALRGGRTVLYIENFAEIWYHQNQIFSLALGDSL